MNDRKRFISTMTYGRRDRAPLCEMSFWPETLTRWRDEGLPPDIYWKGYDNNTTDEYFGLDGYRSYTGFRSGLYPAFEQKTLEDRGDTILMQQGDGVQVVRSKLMSSIPHPENHLLADRESWRRHYRPRLDPEDPRRLPEGGLPRSRDDIPLVAEIGSLYGKLRNWMGIEAISVLIYDDPALFEEMVETMADAAVGTIRRHIEAGVRLDACYLWEDMCFNSGPLIGPEHVRRILLPRYRRITDACHSAGVDIICVDTDGKIDELVPVFLDAGINVLYPLEIGTTGNDPVAFRRRFGKDLRMMGGFDKRILADSPQAIEAEVIRLAPLVEEGGYIPMCDHYVPPDVPLSNYLHFRARAREIWG